MTTQSLYWQLKRKEATNPRANLYYNVAMMGVGDRHCKQNSPQALFLINGGSFCRMGKTNVCPSETTLVRTPDVFWGNASARRIPATPTVSFAS